MKITAAEEYGLRCALRVAGSGPLTAQEVADQEGISVAYVQKLLRQLVSSGVVGSKRGAGGGFYLIKDASETSVGEVLRSLGNGMDLAAFCEKHAGDLSACSRSSSCSIKPVWSFIFDVLSGTLDRLPLSLLLGDAEDVERALSLADSKPDLFCPISTVGAQGATS